ncbi:MAG: UDP-3-O-(3-hydroxymyristoyl)glucosamine N-acyltransferase [Bacteroidota bacterium]|nr:UDP-3-O-(3-hydroxymyristoyl)glucosamine N-acyltransferase [Bacteroidota bacterium]
MEFTAKQIAALLEGSLEGDEQAKVSKVSKIEEGEPGSLSFLANPKYTHYIYDTKASIVIVNQDFVPEKKVGTTLIRVKDAYTAFARVLETYKQSMQDKTGISEKASIAATAKIGQDVYIGDFVSIGDHAEIGDGTKIYPNSYIGDYSRIGQRTQLMMGVKVYDSAQIGNDCTLHAGVVIGCDGFGFAPQADNNYKKVPQIGNVIIEDNVEIGSNTTIDRATLGSTIIRKGVKLDNLIQIAHNVDIGENTVIAAMVGIAGSTKIGRNCMIGAQAGIVGHIIIADEVKIAAQAGVPNSIRKEGEIVIGSPAFDISKFKRSFIHFRNLPGIVDRIKEVENKLKD